jgi:hypothetical protein
VLLRLALSHNCVLRLCFNWRLLSDNRLDWRNVDFVIPVSIVVSHLRLVLCTEPLVVDDEFVLVRTSSRHCDKQLILIANSFHLKLLPVSKRSRNEGIVATVLPREEM